MNFEYVDIGSPQNTAECFCREPPDECPVKGNFSQNKKNFQL